MTQIENVDENLNQVREWLQASVVSIKEAQTEDYKPTVVDNLQKSIALIDAMQEGEKQVAYEDGEFTTLYYKLSGDINAVVGPIHEFYKQKSYAEHGWITDIKYPTDAVWRLVNENFVPRDYGQAYVDMIELMSSTWVHEKYYTRGEKIRIIKKYSEMLEKLKEVKQQVIPNS